MIMITMITNIVEEDMRLRGRLGREEGVDRVKLHCTHVGNPQKKKKKVWCFISAIGSWAQITQLASAELLTLDSARFLRSFVC